MAPEVMMKAGHGIACDIFAMGVIAYECTLGKVRDFHNLIIFLLLSVLISVHLVKKSAII